MSVATQAEHASCARERIPAPGEAARTWLRSYPPGVPSTYEIPVVPYTRLLDDAARDFPATQALVYRGTSVTYRALRDQVDAVAGALAASGLGRGDRLSIVLPTCPQHVVAALAALRLGAVVVGHDPTLAPARLTEQLVDADPHVVVATGRLSRWLARARAELEHVALWVVTDEDDAASLRRRSLARLRRRGQALARLGRRRRSLARSGRRRWSLARLGRARESPDDWSAVIEFRGMLRHAPIAGQTALEPTRDLAAIFYPGSTAVRGAAMTHAALVANAFQTRLWIADTQAGQERILAAMQLSHPFGFTTALGYGLLSAATLVLAAAQEPARLGRLVRRERTSVLPAGPELLEDLLRSDADLTSVRVCLLAGATPDAALAERARERTGGQVSACYGLVEAGPLTHANPVYGRAHADAIGLPLPNTEVVLADLDQPRCRAPAGAAGELLVSGPQLMQAYWRRGGATECVLADGWLRTGDVATIDDEGWCRLTGEKVVRPVRGAV